MSALSSSAATWIAPFLPSFKQKFILCPDWASAEQLRRITTHSVYTKETSLVTYTDVVLDFHRDDFLDMVNKWIRSEAHIYVVYVDTLPPQKDLLGRMHTLLSVLTMYNSRVTLVPSIQQIKL